MWEKAVYSDIPIITQIDKGTGLAVGALHVWGIGL
jgi:hypothetical protein